MPTVKPRDQVAPTLQKAQDTLTDTVLPAVRDALAVARDKSVELLDSDAALEAKRRGINVLRAAKGDTVLVATPAKRRFRFGFKTFALIAAVGGGIAYFVKRLSTPVETYHHTMPVPSGTDGGTTTDTTSEMPSFDKAGTTGSTDENIDLRAGAPTTTT